jgi:hypothetical protein
MMNTTTVKTWRERLGFGPDFPLHAPTDVERAMEAEIAALRAAPSALDYRAQGREEALAVILAQSPESPFGDCIGWGTSGAPDDDGDSYWKEDKLRALLHIDDSKHDAYDRAEAAYYDSMGRKEEAERMMRMVESAPLFKPLHDFLAKQESVEAWELMRMLQIAAHPSPENGAVASSNLTTVPCPCCGDSSAVGCDECGGQGRIIVDRRDLAAIAATPASQQETAK